MSNLFGMLFLLSLFALILGMVNPRLVMRGNRRTRGRVFKYYGIAMIVCLILIGATVDTKSDKTKTSSEPVKKIKKEQITGYEIVNIEDQSHKALGKKYLSQYTSQELMSLPLDKKMLYTIVVSAKTKEKQIKPTVEKIISDITSKDNDIDEITLFFYSDKELIGGFYDVAKATWAPHGKLGNVTPEIAKNNNRSRYKTSIKIKENLEEYLMQRGKVERKFELTEKQRRQFFKDIVAAEDRARNEAEELYPINAADPNYKQENINENLEKDSELMGKYKAQVRAKYKVTKEISNKISAEAFNEGWPLD